MSFDESAAAAAGAREPSLPGGIAAPASGSADDLVLLATPAMRARRHPLAVVAMWGWQTVLALLVSWPAAGLVSAAWGGDPHGDAPLWAPGGHALLDWLWHDARGLSAAASGAQLALAIGAIAGLVPGAALMIALGYATRDRRAAGFARSLAGGVRFFPSMLLLLVLAALLQGLLALAGGLLAHGVSGWAHQSLGEARAEQLAGVLIVPFLLFASIIGVVRDLAAAAVVRFKVRGLRAFGLGARTWRRAPLSLWWSWAWRAFAGILPVLAAGAVASRLGGRGGVALVFLALLHQCVVLARVAFRASWLARALRGVDGALRRAR